MEPENIPALLTLFAVVLICENEYRSFFPSPLLNHSFGSLHPKGWPFLLSMRFQYIALIASFEEAVSQDWFASEDMDVNLNSRLR
jgi:hypothetical protein